MNSARLVNGLSATGDANSDEVEQNTSDISTLQSTVASLQSTVASSTMSTPEFSTTGIVFGTDAGGFSASSYLGSWRNIATRPAVSYATVNVGSQKIVYLRGYVGRFERNTNFTRLQINISYTATTTLLTLPVGARPSYLHEMSVQAYNDGAGLRAYIMIAPDGRVQLAGSLTQGNPQVVSLSGVTFLTSS